MSNRRVYIKKAGALTEAEFRLAWQLRGGSDTLPWQSDCVSKTLQREHDLAKMVLVFGKSMKSVCDRWGERECKEGFVGLARLSDVCGQLIEQFFVDVG
jgi:hypothetical protein